jgi:hypothetical protein
LKITKEDAINGAMDSIAEAIQRSRKGDLGAAGVNLDVAKAYVDMLQKMEAGAVDMRIESIAFGDERAPFEVTLEKGEGG